jgi:adenosylhomocysteine nucleosidase
MPAPDRDLAPSVVIFAAMRWECLPLVRQLRRVERHHTPAAGVWRGAIGDRRVAVVRTGIGLERAAAAAAAVEIGGADLIVSTGCAGGLAATLAAGDLVLATAIAGADGAPSMAVDAAARTRAGEAARRAGLTILEGPMLCSPVVLPGAAEKQAAYARTGAVAVEMESAAIARRAAAAGIPFMSVRVVLDPSAVTLQYAGRFVDPQSGALRPLALARHLVSHPKVVGDLVTMQRMVRAVQDSLGRFFAAWLGGAGRRQC